MTDTTTPKPGDLIIAKLGSINHSTIMQSGISKNFVIFGTVNSFKPAEGGWRNTIKKNQTFK